MQFVKIDFLVWTTHEDDIVPKISVDGNYLIVTNKMIDRFMSPTLTNRYYRNARNNMFADGTAEDDITVPMFQNCRTFWEEVKEAFDLDEEDIKPAAVVPLPFQCTQMFNALSLMTILALAFVPTLTVVTLLVASLYSMSLVRECLWHGIQLEVILAMSIGNGCFLGAF